MKIYLASSWRNTFYPRVLNELRAAGHEVYSFREANSSFRWVEAGIDADECKFTDFAFAFGDTVVLEAFENDKHALDSCDALVLLLPCGNFAHLEAGYVAGLGKRVYVLLEPVLRPELMYLLSNRLYVRLDALIEALEAGEVVDVEEATD